MMSKNLFFNLMKEDGKRRLWVSALTFLAFFFTLPVMAALKISRYEAAARYSSKAEIAGQIEAILKASSPSLTIPLVILSLILGVTSFSYLHSKQKADFYHSIPVRREKLFFANYLMGILIPAAALFVNMILTLVPAAFDGLSLGGIISAAAEGYLFFLLHYMMLYSVTILAMILTGHVFIGIIGTAVFYFYFPALILLFVSMFESLFQTYYSGGSSLLYYLLDKSSVFLLFTQNVLLWSEGILLRGKLFRLFIVVVITLIVTLLALLLYKKRGTEAAGRAMAFSVSKPFIRIPIVVLSSIFGGMFFLMINNSIGWGIFGVLCGLILSHGVIEIIYSFDFKKLFSHKLQMVACGVCALAVLCIFKYDLFGFDRYEPKAGELESMAVSLDYLDDWVDYGSAVRKGDEDYDWASEAPNDYRLDRMKITDYDTALSLIHLAIASIENTSTEELAEADYGEFYRISVKYELKNGKEVYRYYHTMISTEEAEPLVQKLYENAEYKEAVYPVLLQRPEEVSAVRVSQNDIKREVKVSGKEGIETLLSIYQEELTNLKVSDMKEEEPIALIQFMTDIQAEAEAKRAENQSSWMYNNVTERGYYPVYPSFKKTIALLKEGGAEFGGILAAEDITQIKVLNLYVKDDEVQSFFVSDPAEIALMMEHAQPADNSAMNSFFDRNQRTVRFEASKGHGTQTEIKQYLLSESKIPEFLNAEIDKLISGDSGID